MISSLPALRTQLLASAALTAFVVDRIYTFEAPEAGTLPDVVIYPVTAMGTDSLGGVIEPWSERLSVEARSTKVSEADRIGQAIHDAIGNGQFASNGVIVDGCLLASQVWMEDREFRLFRRILDFRVSYRSAS